MTLGWLFVGPNRPGHRRQHDADGDGPLEPGQDGVGGNQARGHWWCGAALTI
jgi:hypothetical protein